MTTQVQPRSVVHAPIRGLQVRDSAAGDNRYTVRGTAVVYGQPSVDLGGFIETMAPGCLRDVLATYPDVHLMWQHEAAKALARTSARTLTLTDTPGGLDVWARMTPTSYAADLRALLEDGVIDQMSFAFTTPDDGSGETWTFPETGPAHRTVTRVSGLYDVTICARGAYPQTAVALAARSAILDRARSKSAEPTFEDRRAAIAAANARLIALA